MKVTSIISEYNPIHNGHVRHIKTARAETNADYIMVIMSGDHVQRGCPALISKYERTKAALLSGADLVIELPLYYSTGSLEYFAKGAVSLIKKSGISDCISFGSECGDLKLLTEASGPICSLHSLPDPHIHDSLAQGFCFSRALNSSEDIPKYIKELLSTPNNLLAASYIAASKELSFACNFHTIKREGSAYHDDSLNALSSTALRKEILSGLHNSFSGRMPDDVSASLIEYLKKYPAMSENDYSLLLFAKIQNLVKSALCKGSDPDKLLTSYLDVSDSLANKMINTYSSAGSYTELCMQLKSKDVNYSRISRALLHILLDIRQDYMTEYISGDYNYFIKLLGFREASSDILHELKLHSTVPIIAKNADAEKTIRTYFTSTHKSDTALRMFREGLLASNLYIKTACSNSRQSFISEYERTPIIMP